MTSPSVPQAVHTMVRSPGWSAMAYGYALTAHVDRWSHIPANRTGAHPSCPEPPSPSSHSS